MAADGARAHDNEQVEDQAQQDDGEFCTLYYGYCPQGDRCTKGGSTLGKMWTEKGARRSIYNHLSASPYHTDLTEQEIDDMVSDAHIVTHTYRRGEEDNDHESSAARPRRRARSPSQEVARRRRRPAQPELPPPAAVAAQAVATTNRQLQGNIETQTRHAISFVRALTRAEKALRVAETVSRRAMETFQDMGLLLKGCACCGI